MAAVEPATEAWLANDHFAECRVLGRHAFRRRPGKAFALDTKAGEVHTEYKCVSCETVLHVWWDLWTGKRTAVWYEYPEGYLREDAKKLTPSAVRALYFRVRLRRGRR